MLAALTIQVDDPDRMDNTLAQFSQASNVGEYIWSFAAKDRTDTWGLNELDPNIHYQDVPASFGLYEQAVENLSVLRANNASPQSQLNFAADNLDSYETGLGPQSVGSRMSISRKRVQISPSIRILTQASAAMVAQANEHSQSTMRLLLGDVELWCVLTNIGHVSFGVHAAGDSPSSHSDKRKGALSGNPDPPYSLGISTNTFTKKWATAGPNLCGGRNDGEVVPAKQT